MKKLSIFVCALCMAWAFSAQAATVNKIAAVVNGEMITVFDLHTTIAPELVKNKLSADNPAHRQAVNELSNKALDMMIMDILIAQEAARLKVSVADGEVDAEISRIMQQSKMSKDDFEKQLKKEGLSPDSLRDRLRKTIMRQKLMGQMVGRKVVVTPEEISKYYNENKHMFTTGGTVHMAMIVYPPKVNAEDWARKIQTRKTSFSDAVREVSVGPNPQDGGRVPPVPLEEMNPAWRQRVQSMRAGQVSEIFTIDGHKAQVHLIRLEEGTEEQSLEQASKQIESTLREPKLMERFQEYTEQLKSKAVIDKRL